MSRGSIKRVMGYAIDDTTWSNVHDVVTVHYLYTIIYSSVLLNDAGNI
jgi:hypothetical protein